MTITLERPAPDPFDGATGADTLAGGAASDLLGAVVSGARKLVGAADDAASAARAGDVTPVLDDGLPPETVVEELTREAERKGLRAWHGSPHTFGRFSLGKIGSGEGAQAYGHGLYFAENEKIARFYRDKLSSPFERDPGALYEVDIKVTPDELLDWDAPLSEQKEKVGRALGNAALTKADRDELLAHADMYTGGDLYRQLARRLTGRHGEESPEASRALREAGIPGIRYLDASSRAAGEGSRNVVIFDDSLVDIVTRNGQPLTPEQRKAILAAMMAGGGAAAALGSGGGTAEAAQPSVDDQHLAHVTDREKKAAVEDVLRALRKAQTAQPPEPGASPTPPTSASAASRPAPTAPAAPTEEAPGFWARVGQGALALGKDVGTAVLIDQPRAIVGGVRDAAQEALELMGTLNDMGDRLHGATPRSSTPELPEIGEPRSTTGQIERKIVQFVTGFVGAGKITKPLRLLAGLEKAGAGVTLAEATAKGAIADLTAFDGQEERFSDLLQELGVPGNVVTDWLAADPADGEIEGRFKNAVEGLALGALADGLLTAGRALRAARRARAGTEAAAAEMRGADPMQAAGTVAGPKVAERDFLILGDPAEETLTLRRPTTSGRLDEAARTVDDLGVPGDVAAKGLAGAPHEPEFVVNWARVDTPDDVKGTMAQMADAFRGDIETARRGVVTFEEQLLGAQARSAWDTLLSRRQGQPLGAEDALAARQLWASSAAKLTEVARETAKNPGPANLFAFRKMLAVHHAIQTEVIAARTETARALGSWRIPVGSDAMRAREVETALNAWGGPDVAADLARRVAALAEAGEIGKVEKIVERSGWVKTRDALYEVWINGLLSGPKTHIANTVSNASVLALTIGERAVAARIGKMMGHADTVEAGEALAQWGALVDTTKDMLRYTAYKARLRSEVPDPFDNPAVRLGGAKMEGYAPAISSEAMGLAGSSPLGRAVDVLGTVVRTPGTLLEAGDSLFKTFGYRMELRALATRQAVREAESGVIPRTHVKERVAEILESPPESVSVAAVDAARYQTFQNAPGKIAGVFMQGRAVIPGARFVLPFVRTPANIMSYTFERTPLAPLTSRFRADFQAGGARRDLALGKVALGSMITATAADMALSGVISGKGPADPQDRQRLQRSGWQPYSVKVGDRWYAFNRLDPVGLSIGLAADMVEILHNTDYDERDTKTAEEVAAAMAVAVASNMANRSYLQSFGDLVEAIADPDRPDKLQAFLQRQAGSFVPTLSAEVARAQDPYLHEVRSVVDAWRARIPGLSDELPKARDLWGRPRSYESGLGWAYDALSPVYSRRESTEPIDKELARLNADVAMPSRVTDFGQGVTVDLDRHPGAYGRYLELAGNGLKLPQYDNKGAMDFLSTVVAGKSQWGQLYRLYSDGSEGGKQAWIKGVIADYRAAAREKLLGELPALRAEVQQKRLNRPSKLAAP